MSLTELIAGVEAEEKTLTVYDADDAVEELRERFADRNVAVEAGRTTKGPERFLVLGHGEEFLAATEIDALLERPDLESPGFEDDPYRPVLDHLDETLFTSYGRRKMLAASREMEDRAWRIGKGQLHAGFQRMSTLATRLESYVALGERDSLTVHAYAVPDAAIPEQDAFVVHPEETDEIAESWFVAYDGAGVDENKCALLAEEREPGSFYGFWTYDPDTVDYIIGHLSSTYLPLDANGGQ
ncbi:DICT sensory domain-containing protein [Halalkalicoccus salilacus]|uniref:DICT sensory domain-containing protein n=1 Tax=Halalkalicoccus TaxID=332246 RepID=UPI002F967A01